MIDYHIHSKLCRHGYGEIYEYVEAAITKGLTEIGFSEHIPIPDLDDPTGRMVIDDWDKYVNDVFKSRELYPEISIKFGIEADYIPVHMDYIARFIKEYPFDYVIGSIHFLEDWDFSNLTLLYRLDEFGVNRLYQRYYELIVEAAVTGLYDIIGHLDLPKKIGKQPSIDISEKITNALYSIKQGNLALDVNTSGIRKEPKEIYPRKDILEQAFQLGIPVVLGSDAHQPDEVAADFDKAIVLLRSIGYKHSCTFNKRQRNYITI